MSAVKEGMIMAFCRFCGKQIDTGNACPECTASHTEAVQIQPVALQAVPQQPAAAGTVPAVPRVKRNVNKGVVALLSLLGVFTVFTAVVVAIFG